ncbi:MuF-C-terminal domain-containing protein [Mitsuokella sp. oral taxon 131]|uniref:MuF-C-terminal domain-containing protein n=1 Tax=Mitsuokella sp. oral taxon 131 TaxID=1321780 RepID=UPI0003AE1692|nr:hypothetical protein [Mitsuokella sp. oral taxon 131]ERL03754.1 hypothetical protein HMPREF1985_01882 [Mitsuokella sp. oral taxon 131 str. W9106]
MIEIAEALQTILERWDALIDRYDKADKRTWKKEMDNIHFPVMQIPPVLQLLGAPKDEIQIFGSFFRHAIRRDHPGMTLEVLRQIPKAATDPLMITKGSKPNSYVFVLELQDVNGATVVVPLELNKTILGEATTEHFFNSAYGKTEWWDKNKPDFTWFKKQINECKVLYVNKNKSIAYFRSCGNAFPVASEVREALSELIVSEDMKNVKTEKDLDEFKRAQNEEEWNMPEEMNHMHGNQTAEESNTPGEAEPASPVQEDSFTDSYYREISDSLVDADPPMPKEASDDLWRRAMYLCCSMRGFEDAEERYGPNIEAWEAYVPQHEDIRGRIEQAGEAYRAGKRAEERAQAIGDAQRAMEKSQTFFAAEREKLIAREQAYRDRIAAMHEEIGMLERKTEDIAPEAMAKCLATAMQFLQEAEKTRKAAFDRPRIVSSELLASTRNAVKDAYFSVKLAPSKVKAFLRRQAYREVDALLRQTAEVFGAGVASLSEQRDAILQRAHGLQSAEAFYREAIPAVLAEDKEDKHSYLTDLHAAQKMAEAGFGAHAIRNALLKESPRRREMEAGQATGIAREVTIQKQQENQNARRSQDPYDPAAAQGVGR